MDQQSLNGSTLHEVRAAIRAPAAALGTAAVCRTQRQQHCLACSPLLGQLCMWFQRQQMQVSVQHLYCCHFSNPWVMAVMPGMIAAAPGPRCLLCSGSKQNPVFRNKDSEPSCKKTQHPDLAKPPMLPQQQYNNSSKRHSLTDCTFCASQDNNAMPSGQRAVCPCGSGASVRQNCPLCCVLCHALPVCAGAVSALGHR